MRRLGLIGDDGSLTGRGNKWRNDSSYADACQEILDEVYPADLANFMDGEGVPDADQILTWFQHQGFGDSNARQMAATYAMIAEKKPPEAAVAEPKKATASTRRGSNSPARARNERAASNGNTAKSEPTPPPEVPKTGGPNIHLDIQIHIPVEASADQIDHIFASMAKHLYSK